MTKYPKVKSVIPSDNLHIIVTFDNDVIKKYDVSQLLSQFPDYEVLRSNDIFNLVHVDCGGYAVAWNDELDISECELWDNSEDYHTPFEGLMSFSSAAEKWNLDDSTLRKAAADGRLIENVDIKKFGKQWVICEASMVRLFGSLTCQY